MSRYSGKRQALLNWKKGGKGASKGKIRKRELEITTITGTGGRKKGEKWKKGWKKGKSAMLKETGIHWKFPSKGLLERT